ncbi:MAG: 2-amino-4-hydroxy-6-hydroxymethyldihydropteridine diphosphokinase [Syntrophobacterales bacterium]|nr:2-amino-4-hydroxy-6-hydroxymethyldihydropteridine diphosphokinase [Syntrophobacterales bacterium]
MQCRRAVERISALDIAVLRKSSLYQTEPVGYLGQDWFVNAAVEIRTTLRPRSLLGSLQELEKSLGRVRTVKGGPRSIDIDILLYDREIIDEEGLSIPHPELHRRRFVLVPLAEIASYVIHPVFGISVRGLLDRLEDTKKVIRLEEAL